uniref:Mitochondrial import inner membrane translocase subunit TIM44 n=1 Tax=Plectus sambesii TaxID=2011161 RepID=A0A914X647_9BILA
MRRFSSICSSAYRLRQRHQQQTSGFRLLSSLTAEHGLLSAQPLACHSSSVGQRSYSNQVPPPPKKNLFENFFDNVREELKRNKELQEQKNVLDAKIKEMAESQALKDARAKFEVVEKETVKSSELVKKKLDDLRDQMSKMIAEVQKTDAGKKISEAGEAVLKKTREAAETIEKTAQALGDTAVYQHVSSSMKTVKDEIDQIADVRMYSRPEELHMRTQQFSSTDPSNRQFEPNTEATGMQLHKDSRWYQSWKSFSENNAYFNTGQTVVSEVLTEITKVDPGFEKTEWLRFVEKQIIPNVLEAKIRSNF